MATLPEGSSKTGGGSGASAGGVNSGGVNAMFSASAEGLKELECPICHVLTGVADQGPTRQLKRILHQERIGVGPCHQGPSGPALSLGDLPFYDHPTIFCATNHPTFMGKSQFT